ncbi:hypothetical protein HALO59_120206 [Halomonas sp. 59]|nr:hypothetical protein HALO113_120207 [Halomonas sp. 113]CAD5251922.1 hypothetical protein HALO59_120206 [Halomonas sp. 59]CAD5259252.1 hypothetical protein HALOI3_150171 [Halomonas sp. I3]CAD5295869.1 hypothetical protein HALO156_90055 [Halomonas sp. 156]VXB05587.1 hypothetical protein HALO98_120065 [Halomonas titanicae]
MQGINHQGMEVPSVNGQVRGTELLSDHLPKGELSNYLSSKSVSAEES